MCNQAVGLVAAELERQGITTVAIQLLKEVAERVRPPRALLVPFAHGYPLGGADPKLQHAIIRAAMLLASDPGHAPPVLTAYRDGSAIDVVK